MDLPRLTLADAEFHCDGFIPMSDETTSIGGVCKPLPAVFVEVPVQ
jgi:hypothetical protein